MKTFLAGLVALLLLPLAGASAAIVNPLVLFESGSRNTDTTISVENVGGFCGAVVMTDVTALGSGFLEIEYRPKDKDVISTPKAVARSEIIRINDGLHMFYIGGASGPLTRDFDLFFDHSGSALTYSARLNWIFPCFSMGDVPLEHVLLTTSTQSSTQTYDLINYHGHCAALIFVNVTARTPTPVFTPSFSMVDQQSGAAFPISGSLATFGAATGQFVYYVGLGTDTPNNGTFTDQVNVPIPRVLRTTLTFSGSGDLTMTVTAHLLPECPAA